MNINIHANNYTVSERLKGYIDEKVSKLDRYLPHISAIIVEVTQQKSNRGPDLLIVEITVRHARGAILRAEERVVVEDHESAHAAVNLAVDKMYRQISRFKGKARAKRRPDEKYLATAEELALAEAMPEEDLIGDVPDAGQQDLVVYRRKVVGIQPMNEEEAIDQMELLGHNFFVFFNPSVNRVNVLYRRENGGYGVLDPKLD